MSKSKRAPASLPSRPTFVLVGPLADAKKLAAWAHEEFRKASTVAFIGVDSGCEPLRQSGLPATLVIGDLDGGGEPGEVPVIQLRPDKDRSDLAVALLFCLEQKAEVVYAIGFQGGRADHDFAVHLDLSDASTRIPRIVSIGEKGATFYLAARFSPLTLARGSVEELRNAGMTKSKAPKSRRKESTALVSLFPIAGEARGVKLRGLRFSPSDGILSLSSQGLSNEIRAAKFSIGLDRGRIAVFFPN